MAVDVMLCYVHVGYVLWLCKRFWKVHSRDPYVAVLPAVYLTFHSVVAPSSVVQTT